MTNVFTCLMKNRGRMGASQSSDVSIDRRLTVVRPSFDRRSALVKLCAVLVLVLMVGVGNVWGNVTDKLTYSAIGLGTAATGSYSSFSDISGSNSDAVYAGMIYKFSTSDSHDDLQMRTTSSNSGIISTTSGGKLKKVTISWSSRTSTTRTINVYGKNSAYSSAADLYSEEEGVPGTLLGTLTWASSDPETELTISGDYAYVGIRSDNGALYLDDISFEWSTKTVSSIALKTSATKTAYVAGEDFAPAGLVITATYSDASTEDIDYDTHSGDFSFSPSTSLTAGTTSTTVTYATKTCSQTITVVSVSSLTAVAEDETTTLSGVGKPAAPTNSGANLTVGADGGNYVFWKWIVTNATLGKAATTKTGNSLVPTGEGSITVKAVYRDPRTITWIVDGEEYIPSESGGTDGTPEVKYNTEWSALTLPTDPEPTCGDRFMGWTTVKIGGNGLDDDSTLNLMDSSNKSGKSTKITKDIEFYAVFADYAE